MRAVDVDGVADRARRAEEPLRPLKSMRSARCSLHLPSFSGALLATAGAPVTHVLVRQRVEDERRASELVAVLEPAGHVAVGRQRLHRCVPPRPAPSTSRLPSIVASSPFSVATLPT